MYARRNSITIAILWLVLLVIGVIWYNSESTELEEIRNETDDLTKQLDGSLEVIQALATVEQQYASLRSNWSLAPKKIFSKDEPSFTLYYLNWLINTYDITLDFDFILENMKDGDDIAVFNFILSGEGDYQDIYRLIWYLTEHPLLYKIVSFNLRQKRDYSDLLEFKMQIQGFSQTQKIQTDDEFNFASMKQMEYLGLFYDVFRSPQIRPKPTVSQNPVKKIAPPRETKSQDEGLVDIHQSSLQAVASGKAYFRDKGGKLITLKTGDRVRTGRLIKINQKTSEVEFILKVGGGTKKVIFGLGYKK
ncbi:hypothetical protein JXJ21_12350 [candidate division KSB1 bacterium]|nr:hypothetical protein [candidate division KSB1 bacterium]